MSANEVLVDGQVVSPFDPAGSKTFYGLVSDTPFSVVQIRARRFTGYGVDNVKFSAPVTTAVPEPTSIALVSSGIAGVLLTRPPGSCG